MSGGYIFYRNRILIRENNLLGKYFYIESSLISGNRGQTIKGMPAEPEHFLPGGSGWSVGNCQLN